MLKIPERKTWGESFVAGDELRYLSSDKTVVLQNKKKKPHVLIEKVTQDDWVDI